MTDIGVILGATFVSIGALITLIGIFVCFRSEPHYYNPEDVDAMIFATISDRDFNKRHGIQIGVKNLHSNQNSEDSRMEDAIQPASTFNVSEGPLYSMASTERFLIVGGINSIHGWLWADLKSGQTKPKKSWSITLPTKTESIVKPEVNSLCTDGNGEVLYAGCGDSLIYAFDLSSGTLKQSYAGHKEYVHCLSVRDTQMASGSQDGDVLLWDVRENSWHNSLHPHEKEGVNRSNLGKWIGCIDLMDDWLVCGGGPALSLWHLRSLGLSTVYEELDSPVHQCLLEGEKVIAAGHSPRLIHFNLNGGIVLDIPSSSNCIYSIAHAKQPREVISIGGTSPRLDFCSCCKYRDYILFFCDSS
ncbi:unnamed protein product [Darwinula stevensoni]|uniref:THO complex subunit 6 n=1 Tax=Darwinula stevensoni TaxID=69355 RepID=A0A7R8XFU6_9CRUS|nr:unnamed protein product [Darwinula stevensoni]CAG0895413.1 unnamed protein product [Darwinula stevensoni]